jgi:hypothetical protein
MMQRQLSHTVCRLVFSGWLGAAVIGCGPSGPETYPVSGTVTFDGEPVPDGYVTLTPEDAAAAPDSGPILAGKFSFRAKPGPKTVEIEASRFVGPENPVMGLRPREPYIPAKYNRNSILREEVVPDGENHYEFVLESSTKPE